jgi:hypothetical protein
MHVRILKYWKRCNGWYSGICRYRPSNFYKKKSHNQHPGVGSPHADQTVHQAGCSVFEPITNVQLNSQIQSCAEMIDYFGSRLASARNMLFLTPEDTSTDRQPFKISRHLNRRRNRAVADIPINASTLLINAVFSYFLQLQDVSQNTVQKRARLFPPKISHTTSAITAFLGSKPRHPSDQKRCSLSTTY